MTTSLLPSGSLSRRHLLKLGLGGAFGLGLAGSGLSLPAAPALSVGAALPFVAYHGVTGAEHQNRFNDLSTKGYRVLSLSIYSLVNDPRYAAVWVQRAGAAQRVVHGITADEYQRWFDQGVTMGFVPIIVSATGDVQNPRFAAVAESNISGPWVARHGISVGQYVNQNLDARENGLMLRSVAIYGSYFDRRYAGVWQQNTQGIEWSASTNLETPQEYQRDFDFFTQKGWRPRYVAVSSSQAFAPIYSRDRDGRDMIGPWVARHNLTADQYQQAFNENTANGFVPAVVQGSGIGTATRYAAIFVTQAAVSSGLV